LNRSGRSPYCKKEGTKVFANCKGGKIAARLNPERRLPNRERVSRFKKKIIGGIDKDN